MQPSELFRLLSPVRRNRESRDLLHRLLAAQAERIEAEVQRTAAEAQFQAERGERASHDDELARCRDAKDGFIYFIEHWCWTFDPRLIAQNKVPYVRFIPWEKQKEFLRYMHTRVCAGKPFLLEKSRDQGATYLIAAYALWRWLFTPGFKTTFCSNDAVNVDNKGDPDSIFEKLRIIYHRLPIWMMPEGFVERKHDNVMQLTNPATGAVITGVTGDNPGRGGRSSLFVVDEAAFLSHPSKVEAAVSGNADAIAWVSTPNPENGGLMNFFARKRAAFAKVPDMIFRLHWRSDPRKGEEWAKEKRATMDPAVWDAEYEISYTPATEGTAIPYRWVEAAIELGRMFGSMVPRGRRGVTGGDVGAGKAKSVCAHRFGPLVLPLERRQEADTTDTAYWMLDCMVKAGTDTLNFDVPGVGAGVLSAFRHMDRAAYPTIKAVNPINTGDGAAADRIWPDERTSEDKFGNLKAEIWWLAREAFHRSFLHLNFLLKNEGGIEQKWDEVLVIPDDPDLVMQLSTPKWFRNEKGKIVIETKKQLAMRQIPSPDDADAFVLTFCEMVDPTAGMRLQSDRQDNPFDLTVLSSL